MLHEQNPIDIISLNTAGLDAAFRGPERVIFTCTATCGSPNHSEILHIWHHDQSNGSVAHIQTVQELRTNVIGLTLDAMFAHSATGCRDVPKISISTGSQRFDIWKSP